MTDHDDFSSQDAAPTPPSQDPARAEPATHKPMSQEAISDEQTAEMYRAAGLIWQRSPNGKIRVEVDTTVQVDDAGTADDIHDDGAWDEPQTFDQDLQEPDEVLSDADLKAGARVVERHAITDALRRAGFNGSYENLSAAEEQRVRLLVDLRTDRALWKRHVVATDETLARVDALAHRQPNFRGVTEIIRDAVRLSQVTGQPARPPALLLAGSPGTGKTRYARALAAALGTTLEVINGSAIPDMGSVVGYPPVWRASGPGHVARALLHSGTSGPVLLLDEIDKLVDPDRHACPENKILSLLERHTARDWHDEFLRVPMRAENIIWIFTANSMEYLSEPFKDRVVTVKIPDLPRGSREGVLETMLGEVAEELGLEVTLENRSALRELRTLGLRRCRLAVELAVARAVADGRHELRRDDLATAADRLRTRAARARPSGEPRQLRAPVGFIHPGSLRQRRVSPQREPSGRITQV